MTCVCKACGGAFVPKRPDTTTFCSRACCFEYEKKHGRPERRIGKHSQRKTETLLRVSLTCRVCGEVLTGRSRVCCSDECRKEQARRTSRERSRQIKEARVDHCHCKQCSTEFVAAYGNKRRVFCSGKCSRKYERRMQRIKDGGRTFNARGKALVVKYFGTLVNGNGVRMYERVNRQAILERDAWTCQVCGSKLTRSFLPLRDESPTVDHILPLALGGWHVPTNMRACCFKCNSEMGGEVGHK